MNSYFIDTSYLLALELANDQNHQAALHHWQRLITKSPSLITTSYIFDEVITYFNSRGHHAKAIQIGHLLLQNPAINLVQVDEVLFMQGWRYFEQHQLQIALTFDHHFSQAGFRPEP